MKWTWMLPFNLSTPPTHCLWALRDSGGSWREASIHNTAALRTHHALLVMMACHAWRPCSPFGSCNPLGCSRAEEIPFHIKHSWGGLLTWILFSASWLQLPLLPNYTRPRWLLRRAGVRTSGRGPGEKPEAGPAQDRHCAEWESRLHREKNFVLSGPQPFQLPGKKRLFLLTCLPTPHPCTLWNPESWNYLTAKAESGRYLWSYSMVPGTQKDIQILLNQSIYKNHVVVSCLLNQT